MLLTLLTVQRGDLYQSDETTPVRAANGGTAAKMVETHIPALAEDQSPQIQSLLRYPASTPHLNAFGLVIKDSPTGSGRGIYATQPIASETLIEISPVLLFPPAEYREYGSKTQLDGYTFIWKRTGKDTAIMALALGLGSLFNHSARPNVKWTLDYKTHSIRYETVRRVEEGEELVISYGSGRMWWEPEMTEEEKVREEEERRRREDVSEEALQMGRIGLDDDDDDEEEVESSKRGVVNGIEVKQKAGPSRSARNFPPIYRLTAAIDPVTLPLTTQEAWIIDIPPTSASLAVKFLHQHSSILQNRDDGLHSTRHLRSFRTAADPETKKPRTQFLLCLRTALPDRNQLVEWLARTADGIFGSEPNPYVAPVPVIAAPTKQRLPEWQAVWPCIVRTNPKELVPGSGGNSAGPVLLVDREKDAAVWTQDEGRLRWALNRFKRVVALARYAIAEGGDGEGEGRLKAIASAVHVTHPYDVARRFSATEGSMEWMEREQCDWSELIGPTAPLIGRVQPRSTSTNDKHHSDLQKHSLLSTLHMSVDEWTRFNTTTCPLYSSSPPSSGTIELDSLDRRIPLRNPLKHAVIDAVSRVSVLRTLDRSLPSPTAEANGSDYLLTSLSLFALYEPCVYCTMALVHSRVSEVYFLLPSPGRGGCCGSQLPEPNRCDDAGQDGGIYALQEQKGLNHSFAVWRWMGDRLKMPGQSDGSLVDDLAREFDIGLLDP
ncbi:hypothetical protein PHSY_007126 [Pseudozyma hubeiensis SY62]|uniref:SET domain-containing protein n=1 Tax=Pseudozyma hubeiensis (strain SY62) TaxID=1305764 RepID=R9PDS5_PSEHS|nr:hypothetical protein PHSY_007126 [Pseudozyma hubeiensis SY62]GAC99524.1 hypothetical protein PHSY_007126 [Pseudozyma hubeiensis SY62]